MEYMKKILGLVLLLFAATSCYEDYVQDYDYSGIYIAYQYDLRSFVIGETETIKFPVALGGVMENDRDRVVKVVMEDRLLTEDISTIIPVSASMFAIDGMKTATPAVGQRSDAYVGDAFTSAGTTALTVLPQEYYTLKGQNNLAIKQGNHTASFEVNANAAIANDPNAFKPYYALAYMITSADADTVLVDKSFAVVAIKCENRFFGNWRRTGSVKNYAADGTLASEDKFGDSWNDANVYELTTVDANTVSCNKTNGATKAMTLAFEGSNITISSAAGDVAGTGTFNGAKLLQDRTLTLNYKVTNADGSYSEVSEVLLFRNRIRDGVNEWQDENPENYE